MKTELYFDQLKRFQNRQQISVFRVKVSQSQATVPNRNSGLALTD